MNKLKKLLIVVTVLGLFGILASTVAQPLWAQVRAALVRDIDTPALAPFQGEANMIFSTLNTQQLLTTVPAGKRLVVEHVSFLYGGNSGAQLVFLGLRKGQFGNTELYTQIQPPHASITPGISIQDGSEPVKAYFEAGDEVWVSASYTGGSANIDVQVSGYYVTP